MITCGQPMGFLNDVHALASAASMGASFTTTKTYTGLDGNPTPGFCLDRALGYAIQAVWTGSTAPVGTLRLQGSNDNITFTNLTGSDQAVNGAGDFIWKDSTPYYKFVRLQYARTSGGGSDTLSATIRVVHPTGGS